MEAKTPASPLTPVHPARAGMDPRLESPSRFSKRWPRPRGDRPRRRVAHMGASARRPTRAGMDRPRGRQSERRGESPRSCGDEPIGTGCQWPVQPLPPHTRACTRGPAAHRATARHDPRPRGDEPQRPARMPVDGRLAPRARGGTQRASISSPSRKARPARAGRNLYQAPPSLSAARSPPQARRGTADERGFVGLTTGSPRARVEEPLSMATFQDRIEVAPRAGAETRVSDRTDGAPHRQG